MITELGLKILYYQVHSQLCKTSNQTNAYDVLHSIRKLKTMNVIESHFSLYSSFPQKLTCRSFLNKINLRLWHVQATSHALGLLCLLRTGAVTHYHLIMKAGPALGGEGQGSEVGCTAPLATSFICWCEAAAVGSPCFSQNSC